MIVHILARGHWKADSCHNIVRARHLRKRWEWHVMIEQPREMVEIMEAMHAGISVAGHWVMLLHDGCCGPGTTGEQKNLYLRVCSEKPFTKFQLFFFSSFSSCPKKRATIQLPFSTQLPCILDLIILLSNLPGLLRAYGT